MPFVWIQCASVFFSPTVKIRTQSKCWTGLTRMFFLCQEKKKRRNGQCGLTVEPVEDWLGTARSLVSMPLTDVAAGVDQLESKDHQTSRFHRRVFQFTVGGAPAVCLVSQWVERNRTGTPAVPVEWQWRSDDSQPQRFHCATTFRGKEEHMDAVDWSSSLLFVSFVCLDFLEETV